jgi:hypothetical protein
MTDSTVCSSVRFCAALCSSVQFCAVLCSTVCSSVQRTYRTAPTSDTNVRGEQNVPATGLCTIATNVCASSNCSLLHVTNLANGIPRSFLHFWKFCAPLVTSKSKQAEVHTMTCHEGTHRVCRYSTTLSLTSALDRGLLPPRSCRFTPEKESRCQLHRRWGGPQGRSGRMRKIRSYWDSIPVPTSL